MITDLPVRSGFPHIAWPAIPEQYDATLLALQFQLDRTQWLSSNTLSELQLAQASSLLQHAAQTVPYYQQSLAKFTASKSKRLSWNDWYQIPILKRDEIQKYSSQLVSTATPSCHLPLTPGMTSGSTGRQVSYLSTAVTKAMYNAISMRDHIWHQRDLTLKLAIIKSFEGDFARYGSGARQQGWGVASSMFPSVGESVALSVLTPIETQLEWLIEEQPAYILSYPTNLATLAECCIKNNIYLKSLVGITSYAEKLSAHQRDLCKAAWGMDIIDMYSASEVGYMALQCTTGQHYHVQSENVLLEVLNEHDEPCEVGQVGRVVVTTLNNFAKPFIRYEIGDHAELGAPCACGRGLPVLTNIMGRTRNMFHHPNGHLYWPAMPVSKDLMSQLPAVRQLQLAQKALDWIEVRIAIEQQSLSSALEREIAKSIRERYRAEYRITFAYSKSLLLGESGKWEEFVCEIGKAS